MAEGPNTPLPEIGGGQSFEGGREIVGAGHAVGDWWAAHFGPGPVQHFVEQHTPETIDPNVAAEQAKAKQMGVPDPYAADSPLKAPPQDEQQQKKLREAQGQLGAAAINPVNVAMLASPETAAGRLAAYAAIPAVSSMLSQDPNESANAILWAGISAGILGSIFEIPGPVRALLEKSMPGFAARMQWAQQANQQAAQIAQDPFARDIPNYLEQDLEAANQELQTDRKVVAKPAQMKKDPKTGEVKQQLTDRQRKQRRAFFRSFAPDIKNEQDFQAYVLQHPDDPKLTNIDKIKKAYSNFLLTDPLLYEEGDPMHYHDPRESLDQLNPEQTKGATQALAYFNVMREMAERGPGTGPHNFILRGVSGFNHALDSIDGEFRDSLKAINPESNEEHLARLAEIGAKGEEEYQALDPASRFQLDMYRLYARATRAYQRRAGMDVQKVLQYVPRLPVELEQKAARGAAGAARPLVGETQHARSQRLVMGEQGLHVVPAFETIGDLNAHYASRRSQLVDALMNFNTGAADQVKELAREAGVHLDPKFPEIARIIKEGDRTAARKVAMRVFTPFRTGLWDIMGTNHFARQIKAAHTTQALHELERTQVTLADGTANWAARRAGTGTDPRVLRYYSELGYKRVPAAGAHYQQYLFSPETAKWLEDATRTSDLGKVGKLADMAERFAVKTIMYNPVIHGMNMASRAAMTTWDHPMLMAHWLKTRTLPELFAKTGRYTLPENWEQTKWALRTEAWMDGVVTPHHAREAASDVGTAGGNALGDMDLFDQHVDREIPGTRKLQELTSGGPIGAVKKGLGASQNMLWQSISDFGVTVYHLEKEAAKASGVDEVSAGRWAGRRANTMMGHVNQLDQNPTIHKFARLFMFAPNWWRTFGEQLLPHYALKMPMTPELRNYILRTQVNHMVGMFMVQKASGEALNFLTSGHGQNQNQPGHQDDLEIQGPLLHAFQAAGLFADIDPNTGMNPQTGAHAYIENPLGRQQKVAEGALGLQSGYQSQPWEHPEDVQWGAFKELAGRLSPLVQTIPTLANIDLYSTLATGTMRNAIPGQAMPNGWNIAMAAAQMTPLGYTAQNIAHEFQSGKNPMQGAPGPFGTTIPKFAADATAGAPIKLITALMGVNAPYETASKNRGTQISDADYRKLQAAQDDYHTHLQGLSQQAATGQITLQQWQQQYSSLSQQHSATVQALIGGTPDYQHGTAGLTAGWEALYSQATDPATGSVDPDKLMSLQDKWKADHSQSQYTAVQAQLRKNDKQFPMLALYHQTLDNYHAWQQQYAASRGISVQRLTAESRQYYDLAGQNTRQAQQYYAQHPELRQYYQARDRQFYRSPQGRLYGAFFGSHVTARMPGQYSQQQLLALASEATAPTGKTA